jgi:tetratricopeptide (TPR) repeat protein
MLAFRFPLGRRARPRTDDGVPSAQQAAPVGDGATAHGRLMLDAPSELPRLGFGRIASALSDIIVQSDPRFAVGIFGGWGTGKTTLMQAIEKKLRAQDVICVRFVAWRYEKEEHLIVPLLDAIRDELVQWADAHGGDQQAQRTAATIGRVVRSLVAGMSVKVGVSGAVEASFDANRSLQEHQRLRDEEATQRVPRSFYHASFRALERAFRDFAGGKDRRRIVVFVDDLDRCLPQNALQVMESMKLFFDLEGFVFVVGLDDDVIEYAVEAKYDDGASSPPREGVRRISGREYIKKVFQLPYRLAPVSGSQLGEFLHSASDEARMSQEQRRLLRQVVEPHLQYLVRDGTVNPREVKRYVNLYTLQVHINDTLDPNVVLALQTISFRSDWQDDVWHPLLEFREEYLAALRRHVAIGGDGSATLGASVHAFPPDLADYMRTGAPGRALLEVDDLDRYLTAGEAVRSTRSPALLEALSAVGEIQQRLQAGIDGEVVPEAFGESIASLLTTIENRVGGTAAGPSGRAALATVHQFKEALREALASGDPLEDALPPLTPRAVALSNALRRLYRTGDLGGGASADPERGDDAAPPQPAAASPPPEIPPPQPLPGTSTTSPDPRTLPPLSALSPYDLGVGREADDRALPYVERESDAALRALLAAALQSGRPSLIVLRGPPASGKTRSLYEAALATAPNARVLAPRDDEELVSVLHPRAQRMLSGDPLIVWLDTVDRFVGPGRALNEELLAVLPTLQGRVVVLATARRSDVLLGETLPDGPFAATIEMGGELTPRERERVRDVASSEVADAAAEHGIGALMLAAPELRSKRADAERTPGSPSPPARSAILRAAIDWSRAGMTDSVPKEELLELAALYLSSRPSRDELEQALAWALEAVGGGTGLLVVEGDGYRAPEFIVEQDTRSGREIPPQVWDRIIELAQPDAALPLARIALVHNAPARALRAFERAGRSSHAEVAASAFTELGQLLDATGDHDGAAAAFDRADQLGSPEAAFFVGARLAASGDEERAELAYRRADERGSARGAARLGALLVRRGDLDGAEAALRRADDRGDASAAFQLAVLLRERGDADGAEDALRRARRRA